MYGAARAHISRGTCLRALRGGRYNAPAASEAFRRPAAPGAEKRVTTTEPACHGTPEGAALRVERLPFRRVPHQSRLFLEYLDRKSTRLNSSHEWISRM